MRKNPVIIIFGATASGKTALAEKIFSTRYKTRLSGKAEIISADSMQVYKGMNIGTAKPDKDFLACLPHHLVDLYEPSAQFGVGQFVPLADQKCKEIQKKEKIPVIMGGTAFYINNFIFGLPVTPEAKPEIRQKIQSEMKILGAKVMWERLCEVDKESAERINVNDEYRITRALEVYESSGKPLSFFKLPKEPRSEYDFLILAIDRPRDVLYRRIDDRVIKMFAEGLEDEFFLLLEKGFGKDSPGMQAIGYREFFMTAENEGVDIHKVPIPKVIEMIQKDSRHYAKRQITFFKSIRNVNWVSGDLPEEALSLIEDFLGIY